MDAQYEYEHCGTDMKRRIAEPEVGIVFSERFREFGIAVCESDGAIQQIHFCPWRGIKLPMGLRGQWFYVLEQIGFDDPTRDNAPSEFLTCEWYVRRRL